MTQARFTPFRYARCLWRAKYRLYRVNRAFNVVIRGREWTPQEIMLLDLPTHVTIENVRYIESPIFEIVPKQPALSFRAWLARLLIRAARRLAPRDHGVMADQMEEAILDATKYGTGIVKTERIDPHGWAKDFDFLK